MAATLTISPSTVTPGATFTASGTAERKGGASASCRILVENVVKSTFSVGHSGKYSMQITAPTGANRTVQVILQQLQGTGQWATTAPARTLTIQGSVPAPQPTIPTVPLSLSGVAGNTTVALSWSAPNSDGGSALTGYSVYKGGALIGNTLAGTTTYTATALLNGTDYQFSVAAKNAIGTGPQTSPPITVRPVAPVDTTPPVISNVAVTSITQNSAVISWVTNENATTQVEYGPVPNLTSFTVKVNTLVTGHSQALTGLTPGVQYRYRVWSADAANNIEWSEAGAPFYTVSSDTLPPVVSGIAHGSVTQTTATVSWSINEPATGQVEYGLTTSYNLTTTLEPGYLLAHAQPLSGLTPNQVYHYRAKSLDRAGNPGYSADRTFQTLPVTSASAIYGPGISGDGLGNTRFQGSLRIQSCRFRAAQSSALSAFTFYYLGPPDPGYALGTGGTWKAEVFADDGTNHYPTGSPLATKSVAALGGSDADRVITFSSPATLVAGTLYHLVFTLTDASPDANHFSTDHWFTRQVPTGAPDGRIVPRFPLTDWAHLYYEHPSGPWVARSQYTPILDLAYANGQHQGMSYGEAQYGPNDVGEITGTSKMVRERFTVSGGNRLVSGAGIRLLRQSGTDPLTVRLEDDAGTLIDSFTIPAASFATGPAPTGANNSDNDLGVNAKWLTGTFSQARTLVDGTTYRLRLSTAAGSIYWAWTNRRLSESYPNYTAATAFQDGYAQVTTNGSTWSALGVDVNQYDLQFYLTVSSSASDDLILIDQATLLALPMSGTAWTAMKARADSAVGTPDISNQDDGADVTVLAKALVYARTSTTSYQTAALAGIKAAVGTETGAFPAGTSSALALGRQLGAYVLSADFISLSTLDPTYDQNVFRPWLRSLLTMTLDNRTLQSNHEDRPNNWGTHAGASRAAVAAYLGDSAEMARTALVFRGYLGDRSAYAGFNYGDDLTWQASPGAPVGINPVGAVIGGVNVDGILPDDMRRGGSFPTVGDLGQSYTWEALQGILLQAELLYRNGYPAWDWSNNAIKRAFTRIHALGYPAVGDDRWQPWLVNRRYGTSFPAPTTTTAGKGFGYADWLYG